MVGSLDFYGFAAISPTSGDNRIAAWAWTGLSALNSSGCASCSSAIRFTGQLFSGVDRYYDPEVSSTVSRPPGRAEGRPDTAGR